MTKIYKITSNNGLTSTTKTDYDLLNAGQDALKSAMRQYGEWIYGGAGTDVEYKNHWLPKLNSAENFTAEVITEKH